MAGVAAPQPPDEHERVAALQRLNLLDAHPSAVFDSIVETAASLLDVPIALMSLVDSDRQWFASRVGLEATETPRCDAFCSHSILEWPTFEVPDATLDERFAGNPLVTGPPSIRFYAASVIRSPNGYPIGTLCVVDRRPRTLAEHERRWLVGLGAELERIVASRARRPTATSTRHGARSENV